MTPIPVLFTTNPSSIDMLPGAVLPTIRLLVAQGLSVPLYGVPVPLKLPLVVMAAQATLANSVPSSAGSSSAATSADQQPAASSRRLIGFCSPNKKFIGALSDRYEYINCPTW